MNCPICGFDSFKEIGIIQTGKLYFCKKCKSNFLKGDIEADFYKEEYFDKTYSKAYGMSYQNDENNIRNHSRRRLEIIKKMLGGKKNYSLLDIGSALGFFCDEAKKMGFNSKGVEISEFARNYAKEMFGISCFESISLVNEKFNCITLWFTLEHMKEPLRILKTLYSLLEKNGILALSFPNGYGAFFRFNRNEYIKKRPVEHIFEPSLKGTKRLLKTAGFKVKKIKIFGLHPERIGLKDRKITRNLQKFLKLGDTFEIYARKI